MVSDYPMAAIAAGALAACLIGTFVGTMFARAGFPLPSPDRRIGCVDGLRGYLALSVMIHHFVWWMQITRMGGPWPDLGVNVFNSLGNGSVALFFMTTGFVFYPRILAGFRRTSWFATYTSRVFRILPLVLMSVAIVTMIIAMRTGHRPDAAFPKAAIQWVTGWREPPLLGYTDSLALNAGVLWSLWYEWLFYIVVLPASAVAMDLIKGRLPSWCLPLALLAAALILRSSHRPWMGRMDGCLLLFASGMLAYECQRHTLVRSICRSRSFSIIAMVCLWLGMSYAPTPSSGIQFVPYALVFLVIACGNDLFGLLSTQGALCLGEISFSIYLMHGIILDVMFVDVGPWVAHLSIAQLPVLLLPMAALLTLCVTPMTYLLIERPAIRTGRWIASRASGRRSNTKTVRLEITP